MYGTKVRMYGTYLDGLRQVAMAVAAGAVAVATVATVEAGMIMEAVEAKAKIMSGMLMRPQRVTVSQHLRRV
jgi:hypothetical protein